MKLNTKKLLKTHEGGRAKYISPELQLRRSVMACLLWEDTFYEDGVEIADRIASLVPQVDAEKVAIMAIEAREKMKLRHVPLLSVKRIIIVTDEQAHDDLSQPKGKGYAINVAPYKNGIGYGKWVHIDGWSEAVIEYIRAYEALMNEW